MNLRTICSRVLELAALAAVALAASACGGASGTPPASPVTRPDITQPDLPNVDYAPVGQPGAAFTISFAEDFDDSALDSRVWNDSIWYEAGDPTVNYAVEDGKLKIWPQKNAAGRFFNRTIDTDTKFTQQYGYFEMRAKLPVGRGAWPAFWLFNHEGVTRPEIDVMEAYSGGNGTGDGHTGWADANFHPTAYGATIHPGTQGASPIGGVIDGLGDLSAGFHVYAAKWEPNRITFYFDGREVYSANVTMPDRMYMLVDLWFGSASGTPDESTPQGKANSFEIDYIRAWKL